MGTVVLNSSVKRSFGSATKATPGTSSVKLNTDGWFMYSNNPEELHSSHLADNGKWLNRVYVTGAGHVYLWHHNNVGSQIKHSLLIYNPNSFDITVTSTNYGKTSRAGGPDTVGWMDFWNADGSWNPTQSISIPAGKFGNIFTPRDIPNGNVFGLTARLNVTNSSGAPASAYLYDLVYQNNSGGATDFAAYFPGQKTRGLANGGYWSTINFATLAPTTQDGLYYTLGADSSTFNGADMPYVIDPSGLASNKLYGSYGTQLNITLPIKNTDLSYSKTFRIFIGSTGGNLFPCFYYGGIGYSADSWDIAGSRDIIEVTVGPGETKTESFQLVVPAVSAAPVVVGVRRL